MQEVPVPADTEPPAGPPAGRYRTRRGPRPRWQFAVLVGVVLAACLGVAVTAYRNLGTAPIEAKQTGFTVLDQGRVEITFQVVRDQPRRPVVCIVRSRSIDGAETGRKEVLVAPGAANTFATTVLHTSRPPVTGEVFGCSYQVPPYLPSSATSPQSTSRK